MHLSLGNTVLLYCVQSTASSSVHVSVDFLLETLMQVNVRSINKDTKTRTDWIQTDRLARRHAAKGKKKKKEEEKEKEKADRQTDRDR